MNPVTSPNPVAAVQSKLLATLLDAIQPASGLAAAGGLTPGKTVAATLVSLDGQGRATASIAGEALSLVLAGPQAKAAALQPGATLMLQISPPDQPGGPPRATLLEVRPPANATGGDAAPTAGPGQPGIAAPRGTPASVAPGQTQPSGPATAPTAAPRALAGPMLGAALANQDSLAPLFANLRSLSAGAILPALPRPLLRLVEGILAQAVPADRRAPSPEALKTAVARSGLFLEARQAVAGPVPAQIDLKAGLQALRGALAPATEGEAVPASVRPAAVTAVLAADLVPAAADPQDRLPPPRRDGPLTAQPPAEPSLSAGDTPATVTRVLLEQTDAALDRVTLSQFASLPADAARPDQTQPQRWLTEIPLAFQSGVAIMPLRIEKEPERREVGTSEGPLWRVRFALDVEPMGPLQGVVTLQGRKVGVTLWAEREATSRLLRGAAPDLEAALVQAHFENGTVDIQTGQPRVMQATAGQFLDRMS